MRNKRGMTGRMRLLCHTPIALGICVEMHCLAEAGMHSIRLSVPSFKDFTPEPALWHPLGLPLSLIVAFLVVGSSNAMNLTNGMDGVAAGCVIVAASALTVLCCVSGRARFMRSLAVKGSIFGGIEWCDCRILAAIARASA